TWQCHGPATRSTHAFLRTEAPNGDSVPRTSHHWCDGVLKEIDQCSDGILKRDLECKVPSRLRPGDGVIWLKMHDPRMEHIRPMSRDERRGSCADQKRCSLALLGDHGR